MRVSITILLVVLILCGFNGINCDRPIILQTRDDEIDYHFFPLFTPDMEFKVKAKSDVHVVLSELPVLYGKFYEIAIGGWKNTRSVIRRDRYDNVVASNYSAILSGKKFDEFSVSINKKKGEISLSKKYTDEPILSFEDPQFVNVSFIAFSTGWGSSGVWYIDSKYYTCITDPLIIK